MFVSSARGCWMLYFKHFTLKYVSNIYIIGEVRTSHKLLQNSCCILLLRAKNVRNQIFLYFKMSSKGCNLSLLIKNTDVLNCTMIVRLEAASPGLRTVFEQMTIHFIHFKLFSSKLQRPFTIQIQAVQTENHVTG